MSTSQIQGELWGTHAEDWAFKTEPSTAPLWAAILRATNVGTGTKLLDLGCGGGGLALAACAAGAEVTGLDASGALLDVCSKRLPEGTFVQGDVVSLPFDDAMFDVVTACNSIQFADDQVATVKEAKRVLKPGGKFAIGMWCEPERNDMTAVFQEVQKVAPPPPAGGPPSLAVRDNLAALVESGGFKIADEHEVECKFTFDDEEAGWQSIRAAGMVVGAARAIGEDKMRTAVTTALSGFRQSDGRVKMTNYFRYIVGE